MVLTDIDLLKAGRVRPNRVKKGYKHFEVSNITFYRFHTHNILLIDICSYIGFNRGIILNRWILDGISTLRQ